MTKDAHWMIFKHSLHATQTPTRYLINKEQMSYMHNNSHIPKPRTRHIPLSDRVILVSEAAKGRGKLKRTAARLGINQQTAKAIVRKHRMSGSYYDPSKNKISTEAKDMEHSQAIKKEEADHSQIVPKSMNRSSQREEAAQAQVTELPCQWFYVPFSYPIQRINSPLVLSPSFSFLRWL